MRRLSVFAVVAAAAIVPLVAACQSDRAVGGSTAMVTTSPAPTPSLRWTADELNQKLQGGLAKSRTGKYAQRLTTDLGDGRLVKTLTVTYDLQAGSWTAHEHSETTSPSFRAKHPDLDQLDIVMVVVDSVPYLTAPAWPEPRRGKWMRLDLGSVGGAAAQFADADYSVPPTLAILLSLDAVSASPDDDGPVLSGKVASRYTASSFIANTALVKAVGDLRSLGGETVARVRLDDDGLPVSMTIRGSDVKVSPALSAEMNAWLYRSDLVVDFSDLGKPVTITAPAKSLLLPDTPAP